MKIINFSRGDAKKALDEWNENQVLTELNGDYQGIREAIGKINQKVREDKERLGIKNEYYIDSQFAISLYSFFAGQNWFSLRYAADDNFWRYLSVVVAPNVVAQRWGKGNDEHFWSKPTRVWFRSLWWFVYLSWQGDVEKTRKVLECKHFSTDTILNFVERNGRNGTYVEAYRKIIYIYSTIEPEVLLKFSGNKSSDSDDLFRVVMKLNTASLMVMDPSLCEGGEMGYAAGLFKKAGVNVDVT